MGEVSGGMLAILDELVDEEYPPHITLQAKGKVCRCPFNGLGDRFDIQVTYVPMRGRVIELEAFSRYLDAFEGAEIAHEVLTQTVLSDLLETVVPAYCEVETVWAPVEGIECVVRVVAGE